MNEKQEVYHGKKVKKEKEHVEGRIGIGKFWAWMSREFSDAATVLILGYLSLFLHGCHPHQPVDCGYESRDIHGG